MLYRILKIPAVILFKLLFRLEVYGKDNIPLKGGFILASNHRSYLDPVVLGVASRRELNFMAKEELFRNLAFAWLIRKLGAFPIRRNYADISALKEAIRRLREGKVLVIFPEGTRKTHIGKEGAYAGVGFLVKKSQVGVLPAFISGTEKVLPAEEKFIKLKKIKVYFGKINYYKEDYDINDIAEDVMAKINALSKIAK